MRVFQLPEGSGYQHYKLKITKFNSTPGTIQFSGFGLTKSLVDGSFAGTTDAARTEHASMTTTLETTSWSSVVIMKAIKARRCTTSCTQV